jgi:gamma-glutamyl-gamma-aminobutyrate hydrolase PuuD
MIRIGLTQRVITAPRTHERRDSLDQRWTSVMTQLGFVPIPLPNLLDNVEEYLDNLGLDGVILTGGDDIREYAAKHADTPERDRLEHALIEYCVAQDLPMVGVCRGLQALVNHFGGKLRPVQDHVAIRHRVRIDDAFVPGVDRPPEVNSFHNFGLMENDLPIGFRPTAWAEDSTVEAATIDGHRIVGIMWHPEREEVLVEWDKALFLNAFGRATE